jgi:DNA-damage-inducible protein D
MAESAVSQFEAIKHTDEQGEYWSARELGKLLGYTSWQNFDAVIDEAKAVAQTTGGDIEGLFTAVVKKSRGRDARDYRLTRHACYLVAESADGRKEEVALAKIYFALTTERYELLAATEEERLRIEHRVRLLRENADLALRAREAGAMTGQEFAAFFNAGYLGLYHETQQKIRERKGLKRGQDISDYMSSLESASNIMRAALGRQMMDDRGVTDLPTANATHHEAGDSVRALLLSKGIVPEQLPTPRKSFQQLLREEEARQKIIAEDRLGLWGDMDTDQQ